MMNRHTKLLDVRDADTHTHRNKFFITCGVSGKEFEICAEDKKTKQSWILAIQKVCVCVCVRVRACACVRACVCVLVCECAY